MTMQGSKREENHSLLNHISSPLIMAPGTKGRRAEAEDLVLPFPKQKDQLMIDLWLYPHNMVASSAEPA